MNPNIVLIVLDAVRGQNIPFYGYPRDTTPFLSSTEKDYAIYENAISSSYWTLPSIASTFTGMYSSGHGLLADGDKLDKNLFTLPQTLSEQGYNCAAFVRNMYVSEYSGLNRGFHNFYSKYGLDNLKKLVSSFSKRPIELLQPPGIEEGQSTVEHYPLKSLVSNAAARIFDIVIDSGGRRFVSDFSRWLKKVQEAPFFAYFHFMETHTPYRAPFQYSLNFLSLRDNLNKLFINHNHLNYLTKTCSMSSKDFRILSDAYDNSIRYCDHLIGKIITLLKNLRLYDNTLIIIISDHGDNIGDHALMFHYFCLYDTLIKIPFLVKYPSHIGLKGRISKIIQNVDIYPTILSILGIEDEKTWAQIQGNDLLEKADARRENDIAISELIKIFGPDRLKYKDLLSRYNRRLLSVRTKDRKFIYSSRGDHEYYDLSKDPLESINLFSHKAQYEGLLKKAAKYFKQMDNFYLSNKNKLGGDILNSKMNEAVASQLKSLGYM